MSHDKTIDYDKVSKIYDHIRVGDPEMVHQILRGVELGPESQVLDVGCGTGNNTILLMETTQAQVIGLDLSLGMLKEVLEKVHRFPLIQAPADALPFQDEKFHFVFMTEVIHHLPDPQTSIQDIFRVLQHGKSVCVVTQAHDQIDDRMTSRFFPDTARIDKGRYPDIDVIEEYMLKVGFSDVTSREYQFKPTKLGSKYLETVKNRGYSMLHKISSEDYERGLRELRATIASDEVLTYSAGYTFVWARKA